MTIDRPISAETAPSRLREDEPTFARYVGGSGWGLILVGVVVVIANRYADSPRLLSSGFGSLIVLVGMMMALVHAATETDLLLRRVLGAVGAGLVIIGVGFGGAMIFRERSWALGLIPALPGLVVIALYLKREDDESIRRPALMSLGGLGLLLAAAGVLGTIFHPQLMPARYSVLLALGLPLTLTFIGFAGIADEWARRAAAALGIVGAVAFGYALLKATLPGMLHDWRSTSENEHLIAFAAGISLLVLGLIGIFVLGKPTEGTSVESAATMKKWGRIGAAAGAFLFLLGVLRFLAPKMLVEAGWAVEAPRPYLVPTGFVLMTAGLLYALVAVGFLSENRLVVLTRRELTAYFVSPIAYCVLGGFVLMSAVSAVFFMSQLLSLSKRQATMEEPIVANYILDFIPVFAAMGGVPLLTMRLFSEEKRSGTLEVLLTAPVNDGLVVVSKFIGSWIFFMLLWTPWWLFLLALRLEGGQEFDFRPMMGFLVALMASGAAFTAMGLFCSSITRDQIISAVLTAMGMVLLFGVYLVYMVLRSSATISPETMSFVRAISFIHMWFDAMQGKLFVRDLVLYLSVAIFWLFATVKVLEARRWS